MAKEKHAEVLLIIDAISDLEFPGGDMVLPWAQKMAEKLHSFREQAHHAGMPVIYANDNFGMWQAQLGDTVQHATREGARGRDVAAKLAPTPRDYYVLKPMHSAFYSTALDPLLEHLGAERLVLTGMATNLCVLFTAHDAHMRKYKLTVLSDCCAAESDFDHDTSITQLEKFCGAKVMTSAEYQFAMARS